VRAPLRDPAPVQHDDLVDLVEPVGLVGDQQGRAARGDREQVAGESGRGLGVQVGGGLVEYQQAGIGQQRPGQGQPLPSPGQPQPTVEADRAAVARACASRPAWARISAVAASPRTTAVTR
jgi:hypothetical protein